MRYFLIGANLACVVANLLLVVYGGTSSVFFVALSALVAGMLIGEGK